MVSLGTSRVKRFMSRWTCVCSRWTEEIRRSGTTPESANVTATRLDRTDTLRRAAGIYNGQKTQRNQLSCFSVGGGTFFHFRVGRRHCKSTVGLSCSSGVGVTKSYKLCSECPPFALTHTVTLIRHQCFSICRSICSSICSVVVSYLLWTSTLYMYVWNSKTPV